MGTTLVFGSPHGIAAARDALEAAGFAQTRLDELTLLAVPTRAGSLPGEHAPHWDATGESYDDWRRDALSHSPLPTAASGGWLPLPGPGDYDW
jgi:hypothetical protein